jgi:hypothetical protein
VQLRDVEEQLALSCQLQGEMRDTSPIVVTEDSDGVEGLPQDGYVSSDEEGLLEWVCSSSSDLEMGAEHDGEDSEDYREDREDSGEDRDSDDSTQLLGRCQCFTWRHGQWVNECGLQWGHFQRQSVSSQQQGVPEQVLVVTASSSKV